MGRTVDVDDLIDARQVCVVLGLEVEKPATAVGTYRKRHGDFPAPVLKGEGGRGQYWVRQDVEAWREANPGRGRQA